MAKVMAARLAAETLHCPLTALQSGLQCGGWVSGPAAGPGPIASTSQPFGQTGRYWQRAFNHSSPYCSSGDVPHSPCSSRRWDSFSFLHNGQILQSLASESFGASLTFTQKDVRRRDGVQCAAKKPTKKKRSGGGAYGVGGAGPRETPAVLLRRASDLYETLMRPELLEEGLVREYVVCARLILGAEPLPDAVRSLALLHDWLPVAELAFLSPQEDNVAQMLPLRKREICECVLRAVPEAKNIPRNMLEYAYEKRESFVKHVLDNVDSSTRETAPSEQDPFAVLGLNRGASSQQVRTAYRAMAAIYHPDRNPTPDAAAKYMQVTKAYEQLKAGGGTAGAGFSAYASIGGRERDDLHGPIDMSKAAQAVGEDKELAVRPLDLDIIGKFTARAHLVAMKRGSMVDRTRRAQAVAV